MTTVVISQPMYFPWAGFFEQMKLADVYVWLDDAQFSKGSFTNRVQVLLPGKQVWMTIPLVDKTGRQISELTAKGDTWKTSHRDLLSQSLRKTPHLDLGLECFDEAAAWESVVDILIDSAETCAKVLGVLPPKILRSSELDIRGTGSSRVLDMVLSHSGTRYVTGHGAAGYLDNEGFETAGVAVEFMNYQVKPWPQRGEKFTPYVTSLDLIATQGAGGADHLDPRTVPWREFLQKKADEA